MMMRKRSLGLVLTLTMLMWLTGPVFSVYAAISAPSVNTLSPGSIRTTSAKIGGVVTNDNGSPITERGFYWGIGTTNPYPGGTKVVISGTGSSVINQKYYYTLFGLNSNIKYSYVAYATNAIGTTVGPLKSFTTKRDNVPPAIIGAKMAANNAYVDVFFSEYVYAKGRNPLLLSLFKWTFSQNGGTATAATVTSITKTNGTPIVSGDYVSTVRFWLNVTGTASGVETIQIWPASGTSVYDAGDLAMVSTQTTGQVLFNDANSPKIIDGAVSFDNAYVDVTMSGGVWGPNHMPLTLSQFSLIFTPDPNGGGATAAVINHLSNTAGGALAGGETVIRVWLSVSGIADGAETVEIKPASGSSIYSAAGTPMNIYQTTGAMPLSDLTAPVIISGMMSATNGYVDLTASSGLYDSSGGPLHAGDFTSFFSQNGGTATNSVISGVSRTDGTALTGGESVIRIYLSSTGTPNGIETITIYPASGTSIYDDSMNAMLDTQTTGPVRFFDRLPPKITGGLMGNGYFFDMTFSKGIYGPGGAVLTTARLAVSFAANGGNAAGITLTGITRTDGSALTGGESTVRVAFTTSGTPSGVETITVTPSSGTSIYDGFGNAMAVTETTGPLKLVDKLPPKIMSGALGTSTNYVDVTFTEPCYGPGYVPLAAGHFSLIFSQNSGNATAAAITGVTKIDGTALTGGETKVRVAFSLTGVPSGVETVAITPSSGTAIRDFNENQMLVTETTGPLLLSDKLEPKIIGGMVGLGPSGYFMDVSFSEGVCRPGGLPLTVSQVTLVFARNGGTATAAAITGVTKTDGNALAGGEKTIRILFSVTGTPSGVETVTITPANGSSIYDIAGNAMLSTQTTGTQKLADKLPPVITSATVGPSNNYLDVTFSEGVYRSGGLPLTASQLTFSFSQNGGTATAAVFNGVTKTDGTALTGGETTVRVTFSVTGLPSGQETVTVTPASGSSIYDYVANAMLATQTTGPKNLNAVAIVRQLVHAVATANGRTPGTLDRTFIPGDKVPCSVVVTLANTLANPVFVIDLPITGSDFYLKELLNASGQINPAMAAVYKNNVMIDRSLVAITRSGNTLRVAVTGSFASTDVLKLVYSTQLKTTSTALSRVTGPQYGQTLGIGSSVEWGSPVRTYSAANPGSTGQDQFTAYIIAGNPQISQ
ncbi:MAG: hypothetical protein ACM3QZ_00280 [Solirubrobacterales bacterium]